MRIRWAILCCLLVLLLPAAACKKQAVEAPPAPALPEIEMKNREALMTYLNQRLAMNQPGRPADEEHGEKNRLSYFGCLEQYKNDDCRFMLCSPYAFSAADQYLLAGKLDDAFIFYGAAYDLTKEEIADSIQKLNQWETELEAKKAAGEATEQDRRHFLFRKVTSMQRLYKMHAEVGRTFRRLAMIFDKQGKTDEAANARTMADDFVETAADRYFDYFAARKEIAPLLNPNDATHQSFYISTIKETDLLLEMPHL
ncbi:MAG TPA: hypothetical protein PKW95_08160 [bacterium]|nr:hypothetical protein [bacterium]